MKTLRRTLVLLELGVVVVLVVILAALLGLPPFGPPRPDTQAPDLLAAEGFASEPGGAVRTRVDFRFDAPIRLQKGREQSFALVPLSGLEAVGSLRVSSRDRPDDEVASVVFPGRIAADDVARATVAAGAVRDAGAHFASGNVLQTVDVHGGVTAAPDLVAAIPGGGSSLRVQFDQAIAATVQPSRFAAYGHDARQVVAARARRTDNLCRCEVEISFGTPVRPVGVAVRPGAVADASHASLGNGAAEILVSSA